MNYSLRAREECNLLAEAMEKEYGIKEVTSDTQYKHGTRTFQISTGEKFGVYKSGMVRKIIKTRFNDYSCYQLNKQYQQSSRAMFLNDDGSFEVKNYVGTARIPIYTEFARLNYLLGYLKRNYGVTKKSPEFVMINGVKYIRDDKH